MRKEVHRLVSVTAGAAIVATGLLGFTAAAAEALPLEAAETSPSGSVPPAPNQASASADRSRAGPPLERAAFIREVLDRNLGVEAARQARQAALERIPQAGGLENPRVSYDLAPASALSDTVGPGEIVRLSQSFPFPGTLSARGEAARAESDAAAQDYTSIRVRLAAAASHLYDEYYVVQRSLEINAEHLALLQSFKRIATSAYETGTASEQDPLQAEVEAARLLERKLSLDSRMAGVIARMDALLHRDGSALLPPPPEKLPDPEEASLQIEPLVQEALRSRPEIRERRAKVRGAEAGVKLTKLRLRPGFVATTSYNSMWGPSQYRWMVGAGIDIPIWRRRDRADVAEAEARAAETKSDEAALEDQIRAEVREAVARLAAAYRTIDLYNSRLLPASRDQVRAALAGFKASRNSFLALIDAERNQRTAELDYEEALAAYYDRRAELDEALGRLPVPEPGDEPVEGGDPRTEGGRAP